MFKEICKSFGKENIYFLVFGWVTVSILFPIAGYFSRYINNENTIIFGFLFGILGGMTSTFVNSIPDGGRKLNLTLFIFCFLFILISDVNFELNTISVAGTNAVLILLFIQGLLLLCGLFLALIKWNIILLRPYFWITFILSIITLVLLFSIENRDHYDLIVGFYLISITVGSGVNILNNLFFKGK